MGSRGAIPIPILKRHELTVEGDTILWEIRVVEPAKLRVRVLHEFHQGHPGVV